MPERDGKRPGLLGILALAGSTLVVLAACSSGPEPQLGDRKTEAMEEIERTKQAAGQGSGAELPASATDPDAVAAAADAATRQPSTDPTDPVRFGTTRPDEAEKQEPTLFEAAQAERQRRQESPRTSKLVLTDENLRDYARGGQLTELVTEGFDDGSAASSTTEADSPSNQEEYWRTRVRDSRLAWRAAADRVEELEKEVAELRFRFYAQDDPAYRDGEIKPAWDRAVIELAQARMRADDLETQVELVLAEGYEAGALPGWLREGIDFEPETDDEPEDGDLADAQVIEPPILEDPPR